MDTRFLGLMIVVLFGLACVLGKGIPSELPGKDIANGDLATVWAARTNPSGTGAGQCTVTCDSGCSGDAGVGSQCGGENNGGISPFSTFYP